MRACGSLAVPWTTLIRSNTTRRSAPMMRSRLRSPTSKSTTTPFFPARASAAPSAAVDVVLPTPPLPDVTTITFPISLPPPPSSIHRGNHQSVLPCQRHPHLSSISPSEECPLTHQVSLLFDAWLQRSASACAQ